MTDTVQVPVTVSGGILSLNRQMFERLLKTFPDGPAILKLETPKQTRSLAQNAYLHAGPFPILADHFGNTIPEIKLILMGECWGWHTVAGHEIPVKPSTASMTVDECKYFIDWLIPWAMTNHDVALPLPGEEL